MSSLMEMMEQVRMLRNGETIQSIINEAYKILGNPIVMFNTAYHLLAYTEATTTTDDPIWNEIITNGTFSTQTQMLFENEGFIEDVANAPKSILLSSQKLKHDRITGKIFNKNNAVVSNLVIVSCNKPFEANDQIVFEAICKLISKVISKSEFYQVYEQTHQETIIKNLIDGNYDKGLDLAQVGIIYDSLESNLYVAVADISLGDPEYANIAYWRDLLKQAEPAYKYAIYSNHIVIIISTSNNTLNAHEELSKLIKVFEKNNIYAGISRRFENLFDLHKHYAQALYALQFVLKTAGNQRLFPFNEDSMNTLQKINLLANGNGIQYFLNKGYEIFGNPVLFHDMELNLLGYTENVEISDPIWQELIAYGTSSYETIELFRTEYFIDIMDNTRGGALLVSDKIKYDRISWRIYNSDDIRIGCTSIVNTMKPFSEDELVLFGVFSQKFSREVKKIEFYCKYGQVYSGTIINRLLSGRIDDLTFYSEDVGNLYDNLMENLYLVVIDTSQSRPGQANLTYFRELFNWPGTVNRYAIYADSIIVIISIGNAPLEERKEFHEVTRLFDQNGIYAGISSCIGNIYELRKYYMEAVEALTHGLKSSGRCGRRCIFMYHETLHEASIDEASLDEASLDEASLDEASLDEA